MSFPINHDPTRPAGFQDADIEMAEMRARANDPDRPRRPCHLCGNSATHRGEKFPGGGAEIDVCGLHAAPGDRKL